MTLPNVLFFGSDAIALELLRSLHRESAGHWRLGAVVSQPDRPTGRGRKIQPNPVAAYARTHDLPLWQPEKPDKALAEQIRSAGISLGVVMAYGHILRRCHLQAAPLGMVNFHASLLPHYRGASPVETAVAEGENQSGITLMKMVRRMDAGPVCDRQTVDIIEGESAGALRQRMAAACVPLLQRALPLILSGQAVFEPQDELRASYCRKLCKDDGQLDFKASAKRLACRINGLDPWPGCFADHGPVRLKLRAARAAPGQQGAAAPGTVLAVPPDSDGLHLATGDGTLIINHIQKPGGRMLPAGQFLQGYALKKGDCLSGGPMPELLLTQHSND